jgi:hypothetical protein
MRITTVATALLPILLLLPGAGSAGEEAPPALTVAVLDFDAGVEEAKNVAATLPDAIEAELAKAKGIRLVTRRDLARIQKEHALNLSGLVADGLGARVGKLVGAKVLIVGRATLVDRELLLAARIIGTETGVFLPAVVRGPFAKDVSPLIERLGERVRLLLAERAAELLPGPDPVDDAEKKVAEAIAKLEVKLPTLGVVVSEEHLRSSRQVDPAAETELLAVLMRLGFPIREIPEGEVRERLHAPRPWTAKPPLAPGVDVDLLVLGQGFSEFAGRVGELVSCKARLEIRAVDPATGEVVAVFQDAIAAADLAETFAGKEALRTLGRRAALAVALPMARKGKAAEKD